MLTLFRKSRPVDELIDAFSVLEADLTALPEPSLLEIERWKSDDFQIELGSQEIALEAEIACLQERLRQVKKVRKAEMLRSRELNTDEGYDPKDDGEKCFELAVTKKCQRGDTHWPQRASESLEAAE